MSDDQIHKEVLKVMGWRLCGDGITWMAPGSSIDPGRGIKGYWCAECLLPPLTLDLMWRAEEMLSGEDRDKYGEYLKDIVRSESGGSACDIWHASATQRARAFLKAKSTPSP